MTIRALLVDDEAPARRRLRRLLLPDRDVCVIGECADGASALACIARERPDLVFLDVQMPERDGFSVLEALPPADMPSVLFVSAFDRYALRAFDVHAVDYLLKPVTRDRLQTAVARARERIMRRASDPALMRLAEALRQRPAYPTRLAVRTGRRTMLLDLSKVDWIESADNYVCLHADAREYLLRETISTLEAQLDPRRFVRIHRSSIVAVDRIVAMEPTSHGDADVVLRDGTRLSASRTWRDNLRRALD